MIAILLSVLTLVGLIAHFIHVQGYAFDVQHLAERMQKVESRTVRLTEYLSKFSEDQLNALWNRASEDIDREIARARDRHRS